jgi:hypothetical protein
MSTAERLVRDAEATAEGLRREAMYERERSLLATTDERVRWRDEAMLEAAQIREAAVEEVAGFLRILETERERVLTAARAEAQRIVDEGREAAIDEVARLRCDAEAQLADHTRRLLEIAVGEGERILHEAEAERSGTGAVQARQRTREGEQRLLWAYEASTAAVLRGDATDGFHEARANDPADDSASDALTGPPGSTSESEPAAEEEGDPEIDLLFTDQAPATVTTNAGHVKVRKRRRFWRRAR